MTHSRRPACRALPLAGLLLSLVLASGADAQPAPKDKDAAPVVKLPDGTFLWVGNPGTAADGSVTLTPQEFQKLLDQLDQLKKQLGARKATPPSACAVRARVEKRGEQLVAALKLAYSFRTTQPQTAVSLGGRKGFLVSATLDGGKLPVLDTTEDGFAVMVEAAGDHTLTLDLETAVAVRGAKSELGFEIGLPRAAISTLLVDPPGSDVKRINLTTRTPDPGQPARPPEVRRVSSLDVKQFAPKPGQEAGFPLGPVESVEVTWDPPTTIAQPVDQIQSADLDVSVLLTEGAVETTAKVRLRGPLREWKIATPANADLSAERATRVEVGPTQPATVTKAGDPNKPLWKIDFPAGSAASDWVVTIASRQLRPKADDPRHRGPFSVGPFTTLDVMRQTGTVRVAAGPNTHLTFKHGPDVRRVEPPGPADDDATAAHFRLTTGPTGTTTASTPVLTVEARAQDGTVRVKPTYRLSLTEAGWRIRAEVRVFPIRTEVATIEMDVPASWRGLEALPAELVEGVQQGDPREGFWAATAASLAGGGRTPIAVRLANGQKQPFEVVLTATVPIDPEDTSAVIPLPRFTNGTERDSVVTASVAEGMEVRGETRDSHSEYAARGAPLVPALEPNGKAARTVTTLGGTTEVGLSRVSLRWNRHKPELVADVRIDVTLGSRQMLVVQDVRLRSPEVLPQVIRVQGPVAPIALRATPHLSPSGPGEWTATPPAEAKEVTLSIKYGLPVPPPAPDNPGVVRIPVAYLTPVGVTRSEVKVRVWSNAGVSQSVAVAGGWLELPVERVADRDSLPSVTVGASDLEPLVLETRPADAGVTAVWADRGLIEAWVAEDGTTNYRARYHLRRWLVSSVDIRLPQPLTGPSPEFFRDGQRVDADPAGGGTGHDRSYRVPLPAYRAGASALVEVRYRLPPVPSRGWESQYHPPALAGAGFDGPVRWQVTNPDGTVPILASGAAAEFRWRLKPPGFGPSPSSSPESLEAWLRTGESPDGTGGDESVTASQPAPAAVGVYHVPRTGLLVVCSGMVFLLAMFLARLPAWARGPGVAVLGAGLGVAAALYPYPCALAVGACQPGLAVAFVVQLVLGVARWSHHRRVNRMPGFSRSHPERSDTAAPLPTSTRNRPSGGGPAGQPPPAPGGG